MRGRWLLLLVSLVVIGTGTIAMVSSAGASGSKARPAVTGAAVDFALFDETGGGTAVLCRTTNQGMFTVNMSFRAITADAVMRVTFQDADWVDYPIKQDTSFSLQQAAGSTAHVDRTIKVTSVGTGDIVGWMSAERLAGTSSLVSCTTQGP